MKTRVIRVGVAGCLFTLVSAPWSAPVSAQVITSIGVLPGDTISSAAAVNSTGTVVVGTSRTASTNGIAVRWVAPGTLSGLGLLPGGTLSNA